MVRSIIKNVLFLVGHVHWSPPSASDTLEPHLDRQQGRAKTHREDPLNKHLVYPCHPFDSAGDHKHLLGFDRSSSSNSVQYLQLNSWPGLSHDLIRHSRHVYVKSTHILFCQITSIEYISGGHTLFHRAITDLIFRSSTTSALSRTFRLFILHISLIFFAQPVRSPSSWHVDVALSAAAGDN